MTNRTHHVVHRHVNLWGYRCVRVKIQYQYVANIRIYINMDKILHRLSQAVAEFEQNHTKAKLHNVYSISAI
jgi:hypothetical protein